MDTSGEYSSPLLRDTRLEVPIVSDGTFKTTGRLRAKSLFATSGTSLAENLCEVVLTNRGVTTVTVEIVEAADLAPDTSRVVLGTAHTIVPKGTKTITLAPTQEYLEVRNAGATQGQLSLQLASRIQWSEIAFPKDDAFYPPKLWKATVAPLASLGSY